MSSTNKTPNLQLSEFLPGDRPAWQEDHNADMGKIDTEVARNKNSTAQNTQRIEAVEIKASANESAITEIGAKADENGNSIDSLAQKVAANETGIDALDARVASNEAILGAVEPRIASNEQKLAELEPKVQGNGSAIAALDPDEIVRNAGGIASYVENVAVNLERVYPVGSIYFSANNTNPATLFGFGTWQRTSKGRVLVGVDENDADFNATGRTGGHKSLQSHTHTGPNHFHAGPNHYHNIPPHAHSQRVTAHSGGSAVRNDYSADGNGQIYWQGIDTGTWTGNTGGPSAANTGYGGHRLPERQARVVPRICSPI